MDISELFSGVDRKVICLVGAGGKKSTMYALAKSLTGTIALSSTTHMYPYDPKYVGRFIAVKNNHIPIMRSGIEKVHAFFGEKMEKERVSGLSEKLLSEIWRSGKFDTLIIKADGARARLIKAPGTEEPLIPSFADCIIPIVSVKAVGRKLDSSIAHRVDLLSRLIKIEPGEVINESHIQNLMTSEDGFLRNAGGKHILPLINMVDSKAEEKSALRIAESVLSLTNRYDSVAIGAMNRGILRRVVRRK